MADEIEKLDSLRQRGAITEEEYQKAKMSLLNQNQTAGEKFGAAIDRIPFNENSWSVFIHLSQFCGYLIPFAGMIVPIVLWQMKKNESAVVDTHGKIVANWIISALIYAAVSGLLCLIVIGIPLFFGLMLIGIIFPIIGAVRAGNGVSWRYPLSLRFIK
jgi:uncharacterized Tic20 family protein